MLPIRMHHVGNLLQGAIHSAPTLTLKYQARVESCDSLKHVSLIAKSDIYQKI